MRGGDRGGFVPACLFKTLLNAVVKRWRLRSDKLPDFTLTPLTKPKPKYPLLENKPYIGPLKTSYIVALRTADVFPVVASRPEISLLFAGYWYCGQWLILKRKRDSAIHSPPWPHPNPPTPCWKTSLVVTKN